MRQKSIKAFIESLNEFKGEKAFEEISILKNHVKKQFDEFKTIELKVVDKLTKENFVMTIEQKNIDGRIIDIFGAHEVVNDKIQTMWLYEIKSLDKACS